MEKILHRYMLQLRVVIWKHRKLLSKVELLSTKLISKMTLHCFWRQDVANWKSFVTSQKEVLTLMFVTFTIIMLFTMMLLRVVWKLSRFY